MNSYPLRDQSVKLVNDHRPPLTDFDQARSLGKREGKESSKKETEWRGHGPAELERESSAARAAGMKKEGKSQAVKDAEGQGPRAQNRHCDGNRSHDNGDAAPVPAGPRRRRTTETVEGSPGYPGIVPVGRIPNSSPGLDDMGGGFKPLNADIPCKEAKTKEHRTREKLQSRHQEPSKLELQHSNSIAFGTKITDDFRLAEKAKVRLEKRAEEPVGAYLLIHPLRQLEGLVDLALLGIVASNNSAAMDFFRYHIAQSLDTLSILQGELNNLNYALQSPDTEKEWEDATCSLERKVKRGTDVPSQVMRVAWNVADLDVERKWRSWWYWLQLKRQERRREKEKESADTERRESKGGLGKNGDDQEIDLDMAGMKLANFTSINKFSRDLSEKERLEAEKKFYEMVLGELRALPKSVGTIENIAGGRGNTAATMVIHAIGKDEELRKREFAESQEGTGGRMLADSPGKSQTISNEGATDRMSDCREPSSAGPAKSTPRAGRSAYTKGRELSDRGPGENYPGHVEDWPSSSSSRSSTAHRSARQGREGRDSGMPVPRKK